MIKTLLNRPLTVITIFLLLSITGVFMIFQLPLDLMPDMTPPYVFIQTIYPAAGPEEVEQEITEIIEDAVSNLAGLKNMTSTSAENLSSVILEFTWGDDIDKVTDEVREKLAQIQIKLSDDVKEPIIRKFDPNTAATIEFSMQGERNISELTSLAKDIVKPAMEQIPGIAKVDIQGSREELVKVSVNQNRMEAYNLSISQIAQALASQNMTLGAGKIDQGQNEFLIKTSGKYENIEQIKNSLVTTISDGTTKYKLRIRDLADVYFTQAEENSRVRVNGNPGINLLVYKQSGTNTVEAAEAINKTIASLKSKVPSDVTMLVLKDSSKIIGQSLSDVIAAAVTGIFCSILILLLFLRQVRSTAIVALSIPVSILITILGMSLGGKTFNIVALTGLTLGVGMIVDASIVILENIYHYRQKGARLHAASLFGTKEMVTPIIASILTSICVFLPILLFGGKIGALGAIMNDMAFTVIVALTASLIVAVFLVPVLAGHFLPIHTREERPIKNPLLKKLDEFMEFILQKIQQGYEVLLKNALQHKFMTVLTVV